MDEATQRFRQATEAFRKLESRLRDPRTNRVAPKEIDLVLIDLDAAIPGLTGVMLGRAMAFKGYVLFHRHFASPEADLLKSMLDPNPQRLVDALACAKEGRRIMVEQGDTGSLPWIDDVIRKLGG